jgi:hypothetical protein
MTTLSPTLTRRALIRLMTARHPQAARTAAPTRYTWLRVTVPVPIAEDSRMERPMLSTSIVTDFSRVIDIAALVAASAGVVAFLSLVCR